MALRAISFAWLLATSKATAQTTPTLDWLARNIQRVESVREVKDVTRTFSQLAQFGRWSDIAALFTDNGVVRVGNITADHLLAQGTETIESWLRTDNKDMDGLRAGSLSTFLADQPVVSLSGDGLSAKARWLVLRLQGDGSGGTRIQGGVFENEYANVGGRWKISLLHYYPQFDGNYTGGWGNTGTGRRTLPIIPYHYTPDSAGIPIVLPTTAAEPPASKATAEELAARIQRLNDEDEVRNLQHTYGFYVDRKMWSDAVDLFAPDAVITTDGSRFGGSVRKFLEQMGPENLTQGILNDHNLFDTIVYVDPSGKEATTRGIEMAMLGNTQTRAASWEFSVFRNRFVKDPDTNLWKIAALDTTHLVVANYTSGWGHGGINPLKTYPSPPPFLSITTRGSPSSSPSTKNSSSLPLSELTRRLSRSAAFDSAESISGAYGYYADDIRCQFFADLHHSRGHKESPGVGYYSTPTRIAQACLSRYSTFDPAPQRPRVPYHWRPQPVVLVSHDARSVTYRARLLQFGTGNETQGGFNGVNGFNGAVYHDQMVIENKNGTLLWKLWSLTIDEFYWSSVSWKDGWAAANPRPPSNSTAIPAPTGLAKDYPPDLLLSDPAFGDRELGLDGGKPPLTVWPDIRRLWWEFRNPVSGRLPEWYAPGCAPCKARPDWALQVNGYQEPPTGPSLVSVTKEEGGVVVSVKAGPGKTSTRLWEAHDTVSGQMLWHRASNLLVRVLQRM
ncbi:SnoaL-like domain-containing protein [Cercophora newfieldiana]|uniref:SnoaL-like domain-containing protein n=1 Tax=Cercophora newfieldiana TaxID=92897 RepID=A0AA40CVW3_9PEZI|nr:SnoaL-like domain-containing protein [Cercophora newfieldiana]